MSNYPKLLALAKAKGISVDQLLAQACGESVVTGICINPSCEGTARVEPDCQDGHCEECGGKTIHSPLALAEIL